MKDPPEILISGDKSKDFFNQMDLLKQSGIRLFELLQKISEKKVLDKKTIEDFEKEI